MRLRESDILLSLVRCGAKPSHSERVQVMLTLRRALLAGHSSVLAKAKAAVQAPEFLGRSPCHDWPSAFAYLQLHRYGSAVQDPEDDTPPQYTNSGRVEEAYTLERTPVFAVVEVGPTQHKVSVDDLVFAEKLKGVDINDKVNLQRVLMLGSRYETVIGRPYIPGASVTAAVEVRQRLATGSLLPAAALLPFFGF